MRVFPLYALILLSHATTATRLTAFRFSFNIGSERRNERTHSIAVEYAAEFYSAAPRSALRDENVAATPFARRNTFV